MQVLLRVISFTLHETEHMNNNPFKNIVLIFAFHPQGSQAGKRQTSCALH